MHQDEKENHIIVVCPNCDEFVLIEELNCCIFRHGVFIETGKQIDPHAPKELCDYYKKSNKIYGCGKPYQIIKQDDKYIAIKCDYI
jgi:hypothetical protein